MPKCSQLTTQTDTVQLNMKWTAKPKPNQAMLCYMNALILYYHSGNDVKMHFKNVMGRIKRMKKARKNKISIRAALGKWQRLMRLIDSERNGEENINAKPRERKEFRAHLIWTWSMNNEYIGKTCWRIECITSQHFKTVKIKQEGEQLHFQFPIEWNGESANREKVK